MREDESQRSGFVFQWANKFPKRDPLGKRQGERLTQSTAPSPGQTQESPMASSLATIIL